MMKSACTALRQYAKRAAGTQRRGWRWSQHHMTARCVAGATTLSARGAAMPAGTVASLPARARYLSTTAAPGSAAAPVGVPNSADGRAVGTWQGAIDAGGTTLRFVWRVPALVDANAAGDVPPVAFFDFPDAFQCVPWEGRCCVSATADSWLSV